jgi:class 3 adenylate cyclase
MQEAMDEVNLESRKLGIPDIAMGIAIHSGRAVVGNIGSDDRVKYGVVGPPVNLAAHLQAHARAGEILLTAAAVARGAAVAFVDEPREVELKGRSTPVVVYPLSGLAKG